jgi:hypothetical protein
MQQFILPVCCAGVRLIAYAAGCNITILASTFQRVQIIPGICHNNVQVSLS